MHIPSFLNSLTKLNEKSYGTSSKICPLSSFEMKQDSADEHQSVIFSLPVYVKPMIHDVPKTFYLKDRYLQIRYSELHMGYFTP